MTNGDYIRRTGDTDLAEFICDCLNAKVKCSMCTAGIDSKGICQEPELDCVVGVFNWLGKEHIKNERNK